MENYQVYLMLEEWDAYHPEVQRDDYHQVQRDEE